MPEPHIVWQPAGPSNHTIPAEWDELPLETIAKCDCGRFIIHDLDDYGQERWRHLTWADVVFYRIFSPDRLGRATRHAQIFKRPN